LTTIDNKCKIKIKNRGTFYKPPKKSQVGSLGFFACLQKNEIYIKLAYMELRNIFMPKKPQVAACGFYRQLDLAWLCFSLLVKSAGFYYNRTIA